MQVKDCEAKMQHPKLTRSLRDTLWNLSGAGVSTIILVVTVPSYLQLVGMERYGVLSLLWALLGYFGFFDFGLSRAAANFAARAVPGSSLDSIFWTTMVLNSCLGFIGGLTLLATVGILSAELFRVSPEIQDEIMGTRLWIAAFLPFVTVGSALTGLLEARGRFDIANSMQILGACLFQGAPLITALVIGPQLYVILPVALIARAAVIVATCTVVVRIAPIGLAARPNAGLARRMISFGSWTTVSSLVSPLLTSLDQFLIGAILGAKTLPQFSVASALAQRFSILPYAVVRTLFPRFSRLAVEDAAALLIRSCRALAAILSPAIALAMLFVEPFLHLWINEEFASQSGIVTRILLLGIWFNGLGYAPFVYFEGMRRPDLPAKLHILEAVPYFIFLYFGIRVCGLEGAAAVCASRMAIDSLLLFWRSGFAPRLLTSLAPGLGLVVVCFLVALWIVDFKRLVFVAVLVGACALVWAFVVTPELVAVVCGRGRSSRTASADKCGWRNPFG